MPYTDEERQLIRYTVLETLTGIGFDMREPIAVQQDIAWLRRARKRSEAVTNRVFLLVTTGIVATIGAALAAFTRWGHS